MPLQPSEYGEKEIKKVQDDAVFLLAKACKKMGLNDWSEANYGKCERGLLKPEACQFMYDALVCLEEFCKIQCTDLKAGTNSVKNQMLEFVSGEN